MEARLENLQCHFNWEEVALDHHKLCRGRYRLEDFSNDEGNVWQGPKYNALGFIQFRLGSNAAAMQLLNQATEVFQQGGDGDANEGPQLVINYGNLAWLHHHMGDQNESQRYLSMVEDLLSRHPNPSMDELHPEVAAEKAWTLMMMITNQNEQAVALLQGAIEKQPQRVEWKTVLVLCLVNPHKHDDGPLDPEIWEKLQNAREEDPENLVIAMKHLDQRGKRGESVVDEVQDLAERVLVGPVGIFNSLKKMLRLYKEYISIAEAVELAERALMADPDERYLKRCAALCYHWMITYNTVPQPVSRRIIDRGVSLTQEVIALYPQGNFVKKINLAQIYAKTRRLAQADEIFNDLLERQMEPPENQVLYSYYAKHLFFKRNDSNGSIKYHMRAAEIPTQSFFRKNSIKALQRILDRGTHPMCPQIRVFLRNLPQAEP